MATSLLISVPTPLAITATPSTGRLSASSYTVVPLAAGTWEYMIVSNAAPPTIDGLSIVDLEVDSYDLGRSSEMDPTLFIENRETLPYPTDLSSRQIGPGQLDVCMPQNELTMACSAVLLNSFNITSPMAVRADKPFADRFSQSDIISPLPNKVTFEVVRGAAELLRFDASVSVITPILPLEILAWDVTTKFTTTFQTSEVCARGPNRYTFSAVNGSDNYLIAAVKGVYEPIRPITQLAFDASTFLATNIILNSAPEFTLTRSIFEAKQFSDRITSVIAPAVHEQLPISERVSLSGLHVLHSNPFVTEFVAIIPDITRADLLRPQTSIFVDAIHTISDRALCTSEITISMQDYFASDYVESGYMG